MVQMWPGRADPRVLVGRVFEARVGATVVGVCGPGGFADGVRSAVRDVMRGEEERVRWGGAGNGGGGGGEGGVEMGRGRGVLDFVEESFTW